MDVDMYDGMQWWLEDIVVFEECGQMLIVFNEVVLMVDWLIGIEWCMCVDWKVLLCMEDDVDIVDVKIKMMKYVSDINCVGFNCLCVFVDVIKVGVGFVDDGVQDDLMEDVFYLKYEDWWNVLWDLWFYDYDLKDLCYIFCWCWVDVDIVCLMFFGCEVQILCVVEESNYILDLESEDFDDWVVLMDGQIFSIGVLCVCGIGVIGDVQCKCVKLIECQYLKLVMVNIVLDGLFCGVILNLYDQVLYDVIGK